MASLHGLGNLPATTATTQPAPTWAQALPSLATALVQARYQDKVLRTNLEREKAGLPPLDIEQYQPGVKVGLDPNTRKMLLGAGLLVVLAIIGAAAMRSRKKN